MLENETKIDNITRDAESIKQFKSAEDLKYKTGRNIRGSVGNAQRNRETLCETQGNVRGNDI